MIEPAMEEAAQADVFVIIGTSLNVYPAAGLVRYVRPGVPIYLIDPDNAPAGSAGHVIHIQKGASEGRINKVIIKEHPHSLLLLDEFRRRYGLDVK